MYRYSSTSKQKQLDLIHFIKDHCPIDLVPQLGYAYLCGTFYHVITKNNIRIGRLLENDVCLQEQGVDVIHLEIKWNEDQWEFHCLSKSGVVVNDMHFGYNSRAQLEDGDVIELGLAICEFRVPGEYLVKN
jgi:pSer/pThr/pTyr-binding forkhead associated (FHA) protein